MPPLAAFVDPARVILACCRRVEDALWTMEEGLRCGALAAVVGEIDRVELAATRRLQLAAEKSGVPALLLRVADRKNAAISAAVTRWRVTSAPSRSRLDADGQSLDDIGGLRWRLDLLRNRFGDPARTETPSWLVEWTNEKGHLAVVSEAVGRPHGAPAQRLAGYDGRPDRLPSGRPALVAVNEHARSAGIRAGQRLADARTLVPDLTTVHAEPDPT